MSLGSKALCMWIDVAALHQGPHSQCVHGPGHAMSAQARSAASREESRMTAAHLQSKWYSLLSRSCRCRVVCSPACAQSARQATQGPLATRARKQPAAPPPIQAQHATSTTASDNLTAALLPLTRQVPGPHLGPVAVQQPVAGRERGDRAHGQRAAPEAQRHSGRARVVEQRCDAVHRQRGALPLPAAPRLQQLSGRGPCLAYVVHSTDGHCR